MDVRIIHAINVAFKRILVSKLQGLEYETGQLAFLMDATVSAAVMWHGLKTYPFTFSIHDYYIKVADTTGYDRSLCNCTQMMQGKQRKRQQQQQQQLDWPSTQLPPFAEDAGAGGGAYVQVGEWGRRKGGLHVDAGEVLLPPAMGNDGEERLVMQ